MKKIQPGLLMEVWYTKEKEPGSDLLQTNTCSFKAAYKICRAWAEEKNLDYRASVPFTGRLKDGCIVSTGVIEDKDWEWGFKKKPY